MRPPVYPYFKRTHKWKEEKEILEHKKIQDLNRLLKLELGGAPPFYLDDDNAECKCIVQKLT